MLSSSLFILRIVIGLIFVAHGSQKLFGWFGGPGMERHTGLMKKLHLHPAGFWAWTSALAEFFGGWGLVIGFLTPFAATAVIGSMLVAILKVHRPNGLWNQNGGYEWPLVLAVNGLVLGLLGPGDFAVDTALGLTLPEPLTFGVTFVIMVVVVSWAIISSSTEEEGAQREKMA